MVKEKIYKQVDEFTLIGENWDGYGGIPLIQEVANNTKLFIELLSNEEINNITNIYPNPHGTIDIEWENNKEEKLLLEIGINTYSYFVKFTNKEPILRGDKNIIEDIDIFKTDLKEIF